jgi:hypothetical protein
MPEIETDPPVPRPQSAPPRRRRAHARRRAGSLRVTPPGLSPGWRRVLVAVLVLQLAVIAFTATFAALRLPYFSPVDEAAHYTYVQQIAEDGSLPVLGKTEISPQALAIERGVYPRLISPRSQPGLGKWSYEAFQPPLYYLAAAPAFLVTSNYVDKLFAVRLFDVVLLLVTLALVGRLSRAVLKERWLLGWSMGLVFLALPGVVVRFVFISNLALTVPMAVLFVTELWIAWKRHSGGRLVIAGLVLGLCVLTELELVLLVPVFVLVVAAEGHRRRSPRSWVPLGLAVGAPVVVTAPWFLFNEAKYHMLTATAIAVRQQTSTVNPDHIHYSIGQLPNLTVNLLNPAVPAEWGGSLHNQPALTYLYQLLGALIIPAALVMIVGTGRRLWSMKTAILGLPWVLNVVEMWYINFGQQWQVDGRYTFATVPILLVLAADAADILRPRLLPVLVTAGATASTLALWAYYLISYSGPFAIR